MTDLNELLERVKKATGPDHELDEAVIKTLGFHSWAGRMSYHDAPMWIDFAGSNITASIDAAMALSDRAMPFKPWVDMKGVGDRGDGLAPIWVAVFDGAWEGKSSTLPLAILAALLSALISKESQS